MTKPHFIPASVAWPPRPMFQAVTYKADWSAPGAPRYSRGEAFPHRTLKAAARRLASLLSGRNGRPCPSAAYIVTPEGERLSLRDAQGRLK